MTHMLLPFVVSTVAPVRRDTSGANELFNVYTALFQSNYTQDFLFDSAATWIALLLENW